MFESKIVPFTVPFLAAASLSSVEKAAVDTPIIQRMISIFFILLVINKKFWTNIFFNFVEMLFEICSNFVVAKLQFFYWTLRRNFYYIV